MRAPLLLLAAVLFATLAATETMTSGASPVTLANGQAARATVTTNSSKYGRILFDGRGRALYAFTHDPRGRSLCSGACAKSWPPYVVSQRARAASAVRQSLLGTIRRANGAKQVTYRNRPLYYYIGDTKPGQVLCQNVTQFGGTWLVVRPNGRLVR
jgi:predicted lipoprotein with Yx(FWY)xxD motif